RAQALNPPPPPPVGTLGADEGIIEWGDLQAVPGTLGSFDWLFNPDEYLGDFAKYLVSRTVRMAVKEKFKEQLRPLASGYRIGVIAHSWGTVVAYDSLIDFEIEYPALRVANLITLGSPLWLVRYLLDNRTGRRPAGVGNWINIYAQGDLIGSWLKPGFQVNQDFLVPNFGDQGPHSSYFVPHNEPVQKT